MSAEPRSPTLQDDEPRQAALAFAVAMRGLPPFMVRHWVNAGFIALSLALLVWVARDAIVTRVVTYGPGSDYWEHAAALRALIENPFHPDNPQVSSPASSPRFGPQFLLVALLSRALGFGPLGAMGLAGCLNTLTLLAGVYAFYRVYFRDPRAPLYGLIVTFASWWDAWHFSNVYQLKTLFSVAGYPSTAAIGATFLGFALTTWALRAEHPDRRWYAALGACCLLWSYVFLTHPLTAVMSLSGAILLAGTEPGVPRARRAWLAALPLAACALATLWPYYPVWSVLGGGSGEESAWVERGLSTALSADEAPAKLHQFYDAGGLARALGLCLMSLLVLPYLAYRRRHLFMVLGALSMALPFVVNARVPLPLGHRFVLLAIPYLQFALVWLCLALTPGTPESSPRVAGGTRRYFAPGLVAIVLLGFGSMNVVFAMGRFAKARTDGSASSVVRRGERVARVAGPNAVVLASARESWSLPAFGPKVVTLLHENPLVERRQARAHAVERFLGRRASSDERAQILRTERVTHVLAKRLRDEPRAFLRSLDARRHEIAGGYELYALVPAPAGEQPR